jgi:ATP synthase protein I
MGEDKPKLVRSLGFLSSLGITIVLATLIGLAMGYYLDQWLATSPWFTLIFLVLGIIAGFRNIYILTSRELHRQKESDSDEDSRPKRENK